MNEPTRARRGPKPKPPAVRFWRSVDKNGPIPEHRPDLGPCWLWTGYVHKNGYGSFYPGGGRGVPHVRPHRWVYEAERGPIQDGYEVDHLCHPDDGSCPGGKSDLHRRCVNPAHLAAVTGFDNNRRSMSASARNARKTHCVNGHEFTEENTYLKLLPNGTYGRECRACAKARTPGVANGAKTHCPKGHEYTPENTKIDRSSGGRRCKTCLREKAKTPEARAKTAAYQRAYQQRKRRVTSGLLPKF